MTTAAAFRKLALGQPGVEEGSHQGHADFRVGGKIFAGLSPDGCRATLKMNLEVQSAFGAEPAFEPCAGAWGRAGWTYVDLAAVELGALTELVREAIALVAKKPAAKKPAAKKPAAKKPAAKKPAAKKPAAKKPSVRRASKPSTPVRETPAARPRARSKA